MNTRHVHTYAWTDISRAMKAEMRIACKCGHAGGWRAAKRQYYVLAKALAERLAAHCYGGDRSTHDDLLLDEARTAGLLDG